MRHVRSLRRRVGLIAACLALLPAGGLAAPDRADAAVAGMQLHVLWSNVDRAEMVRQMDRAAAAGAKVVRIDAGWASLESDGKGKWNAYHLGRLDAAIDEAAKRGIRPLITLAESPCWASSAPDSRRAGCTGAWWERDVTQFLPRNPADYGDALGWLAKRYGSRVSGWEVWNEPNLEEFLRGPDKARRYAALVKAAYPRAKAAAPDSTIIAGALSECDLAFTDALYAAGIKGSFDAFSIHPYAHDVSPLTPREDGYRQASFIRGVPSVRDLMLRRGDDKPLWLTEFGWSTHDVRGPNPWENGVSEATQAQYVRDALGLVRTWSYVPVAIYYGLKDVGTDPAARVQHYGLTRYDGSAKPGLQAFADGARALAAAAATAAPALKPVVATAEPVAAPAPDAAAAPAAESLAVSRLGRRKVRAVGVAPGRRRAVIEVRRLRGSTGRLGRVSLRSGVRVASRGSFSVTFSVRSLRPATYRVALAGSRDAGASVRLVVR